LCSGLTGYIPSTLFVNNTHVKSFYQTFAGCTGLIGNIPSNLFSNNSEVIDFSSTFASCSGLTGEIPENLFINSINASMFDYTFANCVGLYGHVPVRLFESAKIGNDTEIDLYGMVTYSIGATFYNCINLTSAEYNKSEIGPLMFYGCNNLTEITIGDNVQSIGEDAFYATEPYNSTNLLKTSLYTHNTVASSYDWLSDNRDVNNLFALITEWTIPAGGTTINLPIPANTNNNYTVNWGDGSEAETFDATADFPTHQYTNTEKTIYKIVITGTVDTFGYIGEEEPTASNEYSNYYTFTQYLTGLNAWGDVKATRYGFSQCKNLSSSIPTPVENSFENVVDMSYLFNNCINLNGSIPEDLFASALKVTTFEKTFNRCSGLTGRIPYYLFDNNYKATNFAYTFNGCSNLTEIIPSSLFSYTPKVITFEYTFAGCSGLTGSIYSGLFLNNPLVTTFKGTFNGCSNLNNYIPSGLFSSATRVTDFSETFKGCEKLNDQIPSSLFAYNTRATTFESTFESCSNLNSEIPSALFMYTTEVTTFTNTFKGCSGLEGEIPAGLFFKNSKATNFENTFSGCSGLTGHLSELLFSNISVSESTFSSTFENCANLESANINVEYVGNSMFSGCNNLTDIILGNNIQEIGTDAFQAISPYSPTNLLVTNIRTSNRVVNKYNWKADNRIRAEVIILDNTIVDVTDLETEIFVKEHNCAEHIVPKNNETSHWQECGICSVEYVEEGRPDDIQWEKENLEIAEIDGQRTLIIKNSLVSHTYTEYWTMGDSCSSNNKQIHTCECGYYYETANTRSHGTYIWITNNAEHSWVCSVCLEGAGQEMNVPHTDSNGNALTCLNEGTCSSCGVKTGNHQVKINVDTKTKECDGAACIMCKEKVIEYEKTNLNFTQKQTDARTEFNLRLQMNFLANNIGSIIYNKATVSDNERAVISCEDIIINENTAELNINGYFVNNSCEFGDAFSVELVIPGEEKNFNIDISFKIYPDIEAPVASVEQEAFDVINGWTTDSFIRVTGIENYCDAVKVEIKDVLTSQIVHTSSAIVDGEGNYEVNISSDNLSSEDGKEYEIIVSDTMGNKTSQKINVYKTDIIEPEFVKDGQLNQEGIWSTTSEWSKTKEFIFKAIDTGSDIVEIKFQNTNDFVDEYGVTEVNKTTTPKQYSRTYNFNGNVDGYVDATVYLKDIAGNETTETLRIYNLDNVAPTITLESQTVEQIVRINMQDASSGIKYFAVVPKTSVDSEGNVILPTEFGTEEVTTGSTLNYWYAVKNLAVVDANGNVPASEAENVDVTFTSLESGEYYILARDLAGNVSQQEFSVDTSKLFITEWTIPVDADGAGAGTTIVLPIPPADNNNYSVDWGDGNVETIDSAVAFPNHTYTNTEETVYTITINGTVNEFGYASSSNPSSAYITFTQYITGLIQWGEIGATQYGFSHCENLKGEIPEPSEQTFSNVVDCSYLFNGCSGLTGSIPENLFQNGNNIESFAFTFACCTGLTESIPENLFANNPNVITFEKTFVECAGLTGSIPENLFANNPNAVDFNATFSWCSGLTGTIPENLFINNVNACMFIYTFADCTGLSGHVSVKLFENAKIGNDTEIALFGLTTYSVQGTFYNCSNLTSVEYNKSEIGIEMFYGCNNLTDITIGENVQTIGTDAFEATDPYSTTNLLATNLYTTNSVATNYDWLGDSRGVTITDPSALITEWTIPVDADKTNGTTTTNASGDTITLGPQTTIKLPIPANTANSYTVNWGDGSAVETFDGAADFPTHTYTNTEETVYTITIKGTVNSFGYTATQVPNASSTQTNYYTFTQYLTGLVQWGELNATRYGFSRCVNLNGTIPAATVRSFENVTNMSILFYGCTGLTEGLAENLFANVPKVTTFRSAFEHCSNLKIVPSNLFSGAVNVTDFYGTFAFCSALTAIPEGLFDNAVNAKTFDRTFRDCTSIASEIPPTLFANTTKVTDFPSTFFNCNKMVGAIPKELFANTPLVTNFHQTFAICSSLTGPIPEELFANTPLVTTFQSTFSDCSGITGTIPEKLFEKNVNATNFFQTFASCSSLEGKIPAKLFEKTVKAQRFDLTFIECSGLTGAIPSELFANTPEVTTFQRTFEYCTNLTGPIPGDLFKATTKAINFAETFAYCENITGEIPEELFANTPEATSFHMTFAVCPKLTGSIPADLFKTTTKVTTFYGTFANCSGLTGTVSKDLFANTPLVKDFTALFLRCTGLTGGATSDLFASNTVLTTLPTSWSLNNTNDGYERVFYGCTGLTNVEVNTPYIGYKMFEGCNNVTDITIGDNVQVIGLDAFEAIDPYSSSNLLLTNLTSTNEVATSYDWLADNRTLATNINNAEITVDDSNLVYNGEPQIPTIKVVIDGTELVEGTDYTVTYDNNINAGTGTVTITGTGSALGEQTIEFTIGKRELTIIPTADLKKQIGEADPEFTYTYSGNIEGEEPLFTGSLSRDPGEDIGKYEFTLGSLTIEDNLDGNFVADNYELSITPVEFAIKGEPTDIGDDDREVIVQPLDMAEQTVVVSGDYIYNGQAQEATVIVTGIFNGEEYTLVQDKDYTLSYENNTNAGNATVTVTGIGNYSGDIIESFVIDPKTLTVTPIAPSKVFGDADPTIDYTYSGVVDGETPAFTGALERTQGEDVGEYEITIGSLELVDNTNTNFIASNYDLVLDETKVSMTITPDSDANLVGTKPEGTFEYNGGPHTPEDITVTVDGKELEKDKDYTLEYSNNTNAGEATITIVGQGNYEGATGSVTFTINKKALIILPDSNQSKVFGDTDPRLTFTESGNVTGETPAYDGNLERATGESAGNYLINLGTLTLKDNGTFLAANYELELSSTEVYFTISGKVITTDNTTATLDENTFTYDGTPHTPGVTVVVDGDTLTEGENGDYTVTYEDNKDAGTGKVIITGKGDYSGSVTVEFTINKRDLTILPNSNQSKVFGAADPTLTFTASGNVDGETPDYDGSLGRAEGESVGNYLINVGTLALKDNGTFLSKNYNLVFSTTQVNFAITAKEITTDNTTATLDENTFTYDGTAHTPGVTVVVDGVELKEGENEDYVVTYEDNKDAGTGKVIITGKGDYSGSVTVEFTINKRDLTILPNSNQSKVFGAADPTLTFTATGNVDGETSAYDGSLGRAEGESVGNYLINVGTLALKDNGTFLTKNYNLVLSSTDVYFAITAKEITTDNTTATLDENTFTYDGTAHTPGVTVVVDGVELKEGENEDYVVTYEDNKDAGTGKVIITGKGDYTGEIVVEFTINKKDLIIIPDSDQSKKQNAEEPELAYTYSGNVTGETPVFTGALSREPGEEIGLYPITLGTLAVVDNGSFLEKNYNVVLSDTVVEFEITEDKFETGEDDKEVIVEAFEMSEQDIQVSGAFVYNGQEQEAVVNIYGIVNDADYTLVEGKDYTLDYDNNINAGTATVTISGIGNYSGDVIREYTIDQKTMIITPVENQSKVYGDTTPEINFTHSGAVDGEKPAFTGSLEKAAGENVGTYVIGLGTLELADNADENFLASNYKLKLNETPVNFTIEVKEIAVVWTNKTLTYNGLAQAPTAEAKTGVTGETIVLEVSGNQTNVGTGYMATATMTSVTGGNADMNNYLLTNTTTEFSIITDSSITFDITFTDGDTPSFEYDGTAHTPGVIVKVGDKTLTAGTDYEVTYENNVHVGNETTKPTVKVTGINNYAGTIGTENFTITTRDLIVTPDSGLNKIFLATDPKLTYTYSNQVTGEVPDFTGALARATGEAVGTYLINVGSLALADTATFKATDYDLVFSDTKVNFEILAKEITLTNTNAALSDTSYVYDGQEKKPTATVVVDGVTLVPGTDYTISYKDNVNVGTATATIKGEGNYSGSIELTFEITPATLTVNSNGYTGIYDGVEHGITVTCDGATITYGTVDGTYGQATTPKYKDVGTYTIYYKVEKDNYNDYFGSEVVAISKKQVSIVWDKISFIYTGSTQCPTGTVATGIDTEVIDVTVTGGQIDVGTYTAIATISKVNGDVAGIDNYELINPEVEFKIVANSGVTFDVAEPEGTFEYTGQEHTPDVVVKIGDVVLEKDKDYTLEYSDNTNAGEAKITVIGQGNYAGSVGETKFTINKKALTVLPDSNQSKVFGTQDPSLTFTESGNVDGETPLYTGSLGRESGESVGNYLINLGTLALANNGTFLANNYELALSSTNVYFAITAKEITLDNTTATLDDNEFEYDGTEHTPDVKVVVNGVELEKDKDYTVDYEDNKDAGTGKVIITGKGDYSGEIEIEFTITKKDLIVTPDSNQYKVFGSADPTLTFTESGNVDGETPLYTGSLGRESGESVGNYLINLGTLALADNGTFLVKNYNLIFSSTEVYFAIKGKEITLDNTNVTLDENTFTYDGTEHTPGVTVVVDGVTITEGEDGDYTVRYEDNKDAGTGKVIITGTGDYTGEIVIEFVIEKADLVILPDAGQNKNINEDDPELKYTYSGNATGETPAFTGSLSREEGEDAGKYLITLGDLALVDNGAFLVKNYNIVLSGTAVEFEIIQSEEETGEDDREVIVNAFEIGDQNIKVLGTYIYNGQPQEAEIVITGRFNAQDYTLIEGTDYTLEYSNHTNAGNALVTITGLGRYEGVFEQEYPILPKEILVTPVQGQSKTYGDEDPEITFGYDGVIDGEKAAFTGGLEKAEGENVGTYEIVLGTLALADNPDGNFIATNYELVLDEEVVEFNIIEKEVTVVWANETLLYNGELQAPTATIETGVDGEVVEFEVKGAAINVGNYLAEVEISGITGGNEFKGNYKFLNTMTNFSIIIDPDLVFTIEFGDANNYVYDGSEKRPTIIVKAGDRVLTQIAEYTVSYVNNINVGTAMLTVTGVGNYAGLRGTKNFEITPRTLTIIPEEGQYKYFGETDPTLEFTYYGNVGGEVPAFDGSLDRATGESVGSYVINQGDLTLIDSTTLIANNYTVVFDTTPVYFEILRKDFRDSAVTLSPDTFVYDGTEKEPSAGVVLNGVTLILGTDFTVSYENNVNVGTATAIITAQGNYIGEIKLPFTITEADLTVNSSGFSGTYDGQAHSISVTCDGATITYGTANGVYDLATAPSYTNVGSYTIYFKVEKENYNDYFGSEVVTIDKRQISVIWDDVAFTFDGTEHCPTGNVESGVTGETINLEISGSQINVGNYVATATIKEVIGGMANIDNYALVNSTVEFTIVANSSLEFVVVPVKDRYVYDGTEHTPGIIVEVGDLELMEGTDYEVQYIDNKDAGTAKIIVSGKGNYLGSNGEAAFIIDKRELIVSPVTGQTKAYGTLDPELEYTYNNNVLGEIPNFTGSLTRDPGEDVGSYVIRVGTLGVEGSDTFNINNYEWRFTDEEIVFRILGEDIRNGTIVVNPNTYYYDGNAKTPETIVRVNGIILTRNIDYTVTYTNNVEVGTAMAVATGIGNYKGILEGEFVILPGTIANGILTLNPTTFEYDGTSKTPDTEVIVGGKVLVRDVDYIVSYFNNIEVGDNTASAVATGIGNYSGELTGTFSITPRTLSGEVILGEDEFVYDSTEKRPTVIVITPSGEALQEGVDYEVTYENNIDAGTATVVITGIGTYNGELREEFIIKKATVTIVLNDKMAVYTGNGIAIDEAIIEDAYEDLSTFITYEYYTNYFSETPMENLPVDIGVYYVEAILSGHKNYEDVISERARLVIYGAPTAPKVIGRDEEGTIPSGSSVKDPLEVVIYGSKIPNVEGVEFGYKYSYDGNTWYEYTDAIEVTDEGTTTIYAKAYLKEDPTFESDVTKYVVTIDNTDPVIKDVIPEEDPDSVVIEVEISGDDIDEVFITEDPTIDPTDPEHSGDWKDIGGDDDDDGDGSGSGDGDGDGSGDTGAEDDDDDKTIFELTQGDGEKTIYVWAKDKAGNITGPFEKKITLSALKVGNEEDNKTTMKFKVTDLYLHTSDIQESDIVIYVNDTISNGTVTDLTYTEIPGGYQYEAIVEDITGDGPISIGLNGGTVFDKAGNGLSPTTKVPTNEMTADNTTPSLNIATQDNTVYIIASDLNMKAVMINGKIIGRTSGEYEYTLQPGNNKIEVIDEYGNEAVREIFVVEEKSELSMANEPILKDGMTAVYWEDGIEYERDFFLNGEDYNYTKLLTSNENTESKWANAKTIDGSYWVWIPRFAYKVTYYTDSSKSVVSEVETEYRDFDVIFLDGKTNEYRSELGDIKPLPKGYVVADAFVDDTANGGWDNGLEGFWISKYEMSCEESEDNNVWTETANVLGGGNLITTNAGNNDENIRVVSKPNVQAWTGASAALAYANSYNMYRNLNSHLVKNSEWEATFILSESEYGRNGNFTELDTDVNCGGTLETSTTGNITGVFDLLGGVWEYTATYIPDSSLEEYASDLVNETNKNYKQEITASDINEMIYSDIEQAVFEESMLENPYLTSLVVYRGGYSDSSAMNAESIPVAGSADSRVGYRATLTCVE